MLKTVDLSRVICSGIPVYPGDAPVVIEGNKDYSSDGYFTVRLSSGLHAGTHVDMPMHFFDDGCTAAQYPPQLFFGQGLVFDLRGKERIALHDGAFDKIRTGDVVILYTGWDRHFHDPEMYFKRHPVIENGLCDFFAARGIKMLGIDAPAPDKSPFYVHKTLLQAGVFLLENLCGLESLPADRPFELFAVPLRIEGEASPVRAFARFEE